MWDIGRFDVIVGGSTCMSTTDLGKYSCLSNHLRCVTHAAGQAISSSQYSVYFICLKQHNPVTTGCHRNTNSVTSFCHPRSIVASLIIFILQFHNFTSWNNYWPPVSPPCTLLRYMAACCCKIGTFIPSGDLRHNMYFQVTQIFLLL